MSHLGEASQILRRLSFDSEPKQPFFLIVSAQHFRKALADGDYFFRARLGRSFSIWMGMPIWTLSKFLSWRRSRFVVVITTSQYTQPQASTQVQLQEKFSQHWPTISHGGVEVPNFWHPKFRAFLSPPKSKLGRSLDLRVLISRKPFRPASIEHIFVCIPKIPRFGLRGIPG